MTLSNRLAAWLAAEGNLRPEQQAVVAYGALTAMNTVTALALMTALGLLSQLSGPLFCAMVFGAGLRVLSGGAHYSAPWRCSFASSLVYLALAVASRLLSQLPWTLPSLATLLGMAWCFSLWVTVTYAPTDTKAYVLSTERKATLRRLTVGAVCVVGFMWAAALFVDLPAAWLLASMVGVIWQMFTVTPVGARTVLAVDSLLHSLGVGGENP